MASCRQARRSAAPTSQQNTCNYWVSRTCRGRSRHRKPLGRNSRPPSRRRTRTYLMHFCGSLGRCTCKCSGQCTCHWVRSRRCTPRSRSSGRPTPRRSYRRPPDCGAPRRKRRCWVQCTCHWVRSLQPFYRCTPPRCRASRPTPRRRCKRLVPSTSRASRTTHHTPDRRSPDLSTPSCSTPPRRAGRAACLAPWRRSCRLYPSSTGSTRSSCTSRSSTVARRCRSQGRSACRRGTSRSSSTHRSRALAPQWRRRGVRGKRWRRGTSGRTLQRSCQHAGLSFTMRVRP